MAKKRFLEILEELYTKNGNKSVLRYQAPDNKWRYILGSTDSNSSGGSGKSAYQSYVDTTTDNPVKTEEEWVASLKGDKGDQGNSGFQGDFDDFEVVNNLTDGGESAALSAEQGKVLGEDVNSAVASGFDTFNGNYKFKEVDGLSSLTSRLQVTNGAAMDGVFEKDCTITSVTFKTRQISAQDSSKTVTFSAWDKSANTVRALGSLESSALNTVETFTVSWAMYAGEYLLCSGNIAVSGATADPYTYSVSYNSGTGAVTGYSTVKYKIGIQYTYTIAHSDVPSLVNLEKRVESPAFFEDSRDFIIYTAGSVASSAYNDTSLSFSRLCKVDRDCILWSVTVNKMTADTTNIYAFNLSTMKRRLLKAFTPIQGGKYEIIVNETVYKDEYVSADHCNIGGASSGAGYVYTVDNEDNILTLSAGGRTDSGGAKYVFLLNYSPATNIGRTLYGTGLCQGSNIAVFGGSYSVNGSRYVTRIYNKILQPKAITYYGVGGCGYINGTTPVPTQIDNAIASGVMYDLWILWASTNDMGQSVGQPTDAAGNTSQAAAMRTCINKIYAYNKFAKIVVFGSIRAYDNSNKYTPGGTLDLLQQGQHAFCDYWDIPFLDQWNGLGINNLNYAPYYESDHLHMNDRGYELACHRQAQFLLNLV